MGRRPEVLARRRRIAHSIGMLLCVAVASIAGARAAAPDEGTRRMVEMLRRITEQSDPSQNPFMNGARALRLEKALAARGAAPSAAELTELANELLSAGRTADAIARLDQAEPLIRATVDPRSSLWADFLVRRAMAYLRQGEEQNCSLHHNARSCIFPINASGVHQDKRGSRMAAAVLSGLASQQPEELRCRWLLNIAFMTLGQYPDAVPPRSLMPPALFASEYDIKRFPDVAGEIGLDVDDLAGGTIVDDFDGDGYLDIMASSMGLSSQLRYFHNDANGSFTERTDAAGLTGLNGGLNLIQTDYDNDGRLDLLVLRGAWMGHEGRYPNSLLHNNGDGTFSDVTESAGLLSFHPTQTAVWFDLDGDGWLDLFIGNESSPNEPHPCELYRNNGDGTFTESSQETGLEVTAFVKAVVSGDYDNDGRPDLYLSVRGGPNLLFHNDGPTAWAAPGARPGTRPWQFTEVGRAAGVTEPLFSFPTWFWDYDNDGWEDLFVSGFKVQDVGDIAADSLGLPHAAELPRLYHNNRDGTFTDVSQAAHLNRLLLAMGANYGDLDNDGWLDFYAGTGSPDLTMLMPDRAFRNAGGKVFQDVTTSGGFGHLQKGHAVAFADLDNDGDQDIYHVVGGAIETDHFRNVLYENPGHGNHWIDLRLEGVAANRPAIGSRIQVVVSEGGNRRSIYKTVRSGGSFGASPLRQEIGLGSADRILSIEIRWPGSGRTQILSGVPMDRHYLMREGESAPKVVPLRSFKLGQAAPDAAR